MTNWNLLFRRTHLYLGMLLLPWMLMYAVSTVLFNHGQFRPHGANAPQWLPLWEKDYAVEIAPGNDALRESAARIIDENGLQGAFGVQRQGQKLVINVMNFWQPIRLSYDLEGRKLRAEKKKFVGSEVLVRLHQRVGYGQPGLLNMLWAVFVDVFCFATLGWIATGLYLWWKLPVTRSWGWIAIAGGFLSIAILVGTL